MSKKSEAERLRKAKELAGNDGHEWDALDGAVQHSYFHAADVVLRPKPKAPLKEKHGHVHEVAQKAIDEVAGASDEPKTMTTEELLEMGIRVAPPEEKKTEEVTDGNLAMRGAGSDNKPPGSKNPSKSKRTRKSTAGKKTRG